LIEKFIRRNDVVSWRSVGFVGLGDLGGAIARRMVDCGVSLTVFDPDKDAMDRVTCKGGQGVQSPQAVAAVSDLVMCCLPHPRILKEVVLGENGLIHGLRQGSVVMDLSTSGPEAVREVGEVLTSKGINMIEGAVGKGPWAAEKGDLTIMLGGDKNICREIEALIRLVGSNIYYCGPLGAGQTVKVINNLLSCANLAVAIEAVTLAIRSGVDLDIVTKVLPQTAADSWHLRNTVIDKILNQADFTPIFKLKLAQKDLQLAVEMAENLDAPHTCASGALEWFDKGVVRGMDDLDQSAILLTANPDFGSSKKATDIES
jgi:3-hydroxyisobutyrate dehydrogenase-like beta-hydroxyacid dehydrogenase